MRVRKWSNGAACLVTGDGYIVFIAEEIEDNKPKRTKITIRSGSDNVSQEFFLSQDFADQVNVEITGMKPQVLTVLGTVRDAWTADRRERFAQDAKEKLGLNIIYKDASKNGNRFIQVYHVDEAKLPKQGIENAQTWIRGWCDALEVKFEPFIK